MTYTVTVKGTGWPKLGPGKASGNSAVPLHISHAREPESGYWTARSTNSTRYSYRTAGWVAAKRLDFSPRAGPDS